MNENEVNQQLIYLFDNEQETRRKAAIEYFSRMFISEGIFTLQIFKQHSWYVVLQSRITQLFEVQHNTDSSEVVHLHQPSKKTKQNRFTNFKM
jgi:hypothetical protein